MKQRCTNPASLFYDRYGGRGISICDDWLHDFKAFRAWALSHGYERGLVIDRRDNDGHYTPANCRWVTYRISSENRSDAFLATAFGDTLNVSAWARDPRCCVKEATLRRRLRAGWGPEEALSIPAGGRPRAGRPRATYCVHGHPLSGDNLSITPSGSHVCKTCARARNRRYKTKMKVLRGGIGLATTGPAGRRLEDRADTQPGTMTT